MSQIPPPMGTPPVGYQTPGPSRPQGLAIGALVCGILSLVLFCAWFISVPLGIVAIILGVVGRGKAQRGEAGGEGLAKTGMILGVVGTILSIVWVILILTGASFLGSWAEKKAKELEQQTQQGQVEDSSVDAPATTEAP